MIDRQTLHKKIEENPFLVLEDVIYHSLRNDIIELQLTPGSKLNESKLAEDLGISRSPIRNALQKLYQEGLIHKKANKLSVVSALSKEECHQIMEARLAIEGFAAYLATFHITEEQLKQLQFWISQYENASNGKSTTDIAAHAACDHRFHAIIIEASNNAYIQEMYQKIEGRIFHYRNCILHTISQENSTKILSSAVKQHLAIYHALKLGFSEMAKIEIENDIRSMVNVFMAWET